MKIKASPGTTTECISNTYGCLGADPSVLVKGDRYTVTHVEVFDWYTLIYLEGHERGFNSVLFDLDIGPYLKQWMDNVHGNTEPNHTEVTATVKDVEFIFPKDAPVRFSGIISEYPKHPAYVGEPLRSSPIVKVVISAMGTMIYTRNSLYRVLVPAAQMEILSKNYPELLVKDM